MDKPPAPWPPWPAPSARANVTGGGANYNSDILTIRCAYWRIQRPNKHTSCLHPDSYFEPDGGGPPAGRESRAAVPDAGWGLDEFQEKGVEGMDGKAHDVEIGSLDPCDSDVADPFLDAIGPSLVKRLIILYVI